MYLRYAISRDDQYKIIGSIAIFLDVLQIFCSYLHNKKTPIESTIVYINTHV